MANSRSLTVNNFVVSHCMANSIPGVGPVMWKYPRATIGSVSQCIVRLRAQLWLFRIRCCPSGENHEVKCPYPRVYCVPIMKRPFSTCWLAVQWSSVCCPSSYPNRHNMVAHALHWHLCSAFGLPAVASWHSHEHLPVVENEQAKILWDFGIQTLTTVGSNHPDIVVFLKECPTGILLLEISCPADMNILMKEEEKITKYQPLVQQMRQIYNQPVQVIPIVFGVVRMASKNQRMYLKKIPAYKDRLFATYLADGRYTGNNIYPSRTEHMLYLRLYARYVILITVLLCVTTC